MSNQESKFDFLAVLKEFVFLEKASLGCEQHKITVLSAYF